MILLRVVMELLLPHAELSSGFTFFESFREPTMSDPDAGLSRLAKFTTAGLAGIMGWVVIHPFNTLAVRMNLANYTKVSNVPSLLSHN